MTNKRALELEKLCDEKMSEYLGESCDVSMALTGRLKIMFEDGFITLNKAFNGADYVNYMGDYDDLVDKINRAVACVADNGRLFDMLIWSYHHRPELEEE